MLAEDLRSEKLSRNALKVSSADMAKPLLSTNDSTVLRAETKLDTLVDMEIKCSDNFQKGVDAVRKGPRYHIPLLLKDFFMGRHKGPDYQILGMLLLLGLLLAGEALIFTKNHERSIAVLIAVLKLWLILAIFSLSRWFFLLEFRPKDCVLPVLLHLFTCRVVNEVFVEDQAFGLGIYASVLFITFAVIAPALVVFMFALINWQAFDYKITPLGWKITAFFVFLVTVWVLILAVNIDELSFGIVAVGLELILFFYFYAMVDFFDRGRQFRPILKKGITGITLALLVLIYYTLAYIGADWFASVTSTFCIGLIVLLFLAATNVYETKSRFVQPSKHVYPIYLFEPSVTGFNCRVDNKGFHFWFSACVVLIFWGIAGSQLFEALHSWVGWLAYSSGLFLTYLTLMHAYFSGPRDFWEAYLGVVTMDPEVAKRTKASVMHSQFRRDETVEFERKTESLTNATSKLTTVRKYWQWAHDSSIPKLEYDLFRLSPQAIKPEKSWIDVYQSAAHKLNDTYAELNRVCMEFYLSIRQAHIAVTEQRQQDTKAFLENYKSQLSLPDFQGMTRFQFESWLKANTMILASRRDIYLREAEATALQIKLNEDKLKKLREEQKRNAFFALAARSVLGN